MNVKYSFSCKIDFVVENLERKKYFFSAKHHLQRTHQNKKTLQLLSQWIKILAPYGDSFLAEAFDHWTKRVSAAFSPYSFQMVFIELAPSLIQSSNVCNKNEALKRLCILSRQFHRWVRIANKLWRTGLQDWNNLKLWTNSSYLNSCDITKVCPELIIIS